MRRLRAIFSAMMICVAGIMGPAMAADGARVPTSQATVDQKRQLIENMVHKSVAAKTIAQSGDSDAIAALNKAKALVEEAKMAGAGGRYKEEDDKLNEALKLVNEHARRLTMGSAGAERAKVLYDRRRHAVETFASAYERVSSDPTAGSSQLPKGHAAWIAGKLAEADSVFAKGQHEKAQELLDSAYERTLGLIRTMRAGQTLTRSLNFATAEEEYLYELKRNDSFFALLEFAIVEKNPTGSVVERIRQNRDTARGVRGTAEGTAKTGDHATAITELASSTKMLLQAIRMSGIFIPD